MNPAKNTVPRPSPSTYERTRISRRSIRVACARRSHHRSQNAKPASSPTAGASSHHGRDDSSALSPSTSGSSAQSIAAANSSTPTGSSDCRWRGGSAGSSRRTSSSATMPTGTLTRNTQRHPSSPPAVTSSPPSSGPTAVEIPTVMPNSPNALPRSTPRNIVWMNPDTCGETSPALNPCASRNTTSHPAEGATPHSALKVVNSPSPKANTPRRLRASPSRPAGTRTMPNASA